MVPMTDDRKPVPADDGSTETALLVRRANNGDPASFHDLFRRVAPALYAWANLHIPAALRPRLDPDDLLQEVCFRALRHLVTYDPSQSPFRSWLFGIANNVLRETARAVARLPMSRQLQTESGSRRGLDSFASMTTALTTRIARDEGMRKLLDRLRELPEDDRRLLIYRGLEGLPLADVAGLMGVPAATIAKRWQRLRQKIAEQSGPYHLFAGSD